VENQAPTRALRRTLPVRDGLVAPDGPVARLALVERHRASGAVVNAFVEGFGYDRPCAVASTVSHDCHHLLIVGTDARDMAAAANRLAEVGGGVTVWSEGVELALLEMPIAGLMSDQRADVVAAKADAVLAAMAACGCGLANGFMQHSLLALAVIPALRISDRGLVDVDRFALTEALIPSA
jgi:adenine deaminase